MDYVIYDIANGILQWEGPAYDQIDAWKQFRSELGYDKDIPGVCERSKYLIETRRDFDNAGR